MTKEEAINFAALQDRLAAKEAECRELRKELHDMRSHAQILQNKRSVMELKYEDLLGKGSDWGTKPGLERGAEPSNLVFEGRLLLWRQKSRHGPSPLLFLSDRHLL